MQYRCNNLLFFVKRTIITCSVQCSVCVLDTHIHKTHHLITLTFTFRLQKPRFRNKSKELWCTLTVNTALRTENRVGAWKPWLTTSDKKIEWICNKSLCWQLCDRQCKWIVFHFKLHPSCDEFYKKQGDINIGIIHFSSSTSRKWRSMNQCRMEVDTRLMFPYVIISRYDYRVYEVVDSYEMYFAAYHFKVMHKCLLKVFKLWWYIRRSIGYWWAF